MAEPARTLTSGCAWLSGQLEDAVVAAITSGDPRPSASLRALVLAGSMARRESGWLLGNGGARLLGDAEFLCILREGVSPPQPGELRVWHERVQTRLRREGLRADVSLTPAPLRYLRSLPPHVFGYELRHTGRVLWGDPHVLQEAPASPVSEIPPEDAWRLLTNRLIELLPSAFATASPRTPQQVYPWVKLYLDIATSYLLFAGGYAPSYLMRAQRLRRHLEGKGRPRPPFMTPRLVEQVEACTAWKLNPHADIATLFPSGFRTEALDCTRQLWQWQLRQLTASPADAGGRLWRRWQRRQSIAARWRGWASALRHAGMPSPACWARWLALACYASPRHCIYEAGIELLFGDSPESVRQVRALALLPLPPASPPASSEELAAAVLANYHRLVAATRA